MFFLPRAKRYVQVNSYLNFINSASSRSRRYEIRIRDKYLFYCQLLFSKTPKTDICIFSSSVSHFDYGVIGNRNNGGRRKSHMYVCICTSAFYTSCACGCECMGILRIGEKRKCLFLKSFLLSSHSHPCVVVNCKTLFYFILFLFSCT